MEKIDEVLAKMFYLASIVTGAAFFSTKYTIYVVMMFVSLVLAGQFRNEYIHRRR